MLTRGDFWVGVLVGVALVWAYRKWAAGRASGQ